MLCSTCLIQLTLGYRIGSDQFFSHLKNYGNANILYLGFYFQDGINWLGFLNKYNLHGILCDDMGLGKTLQSICIIAGDNYRRQLRYQVGILCDDMGLGKTLQFICIIAGDTG